MSTDIPSPAIQRHRLADQAYEILRNQILERQLLPGERLSVPKLATQLGLSRSPVREAVQRLVAEGLGIEHINRGAVVAGVDAGEIDDLYEVRALLEGLSARRAAARVTPEVTAELMTLLEQHAAAIEAGNEPDIIRADIRFHTRILSAASSSYLTRALSPILGRVNLTMLAGDLSSWPKDAVEEHRAVLEAISRGDLKGAESAARRHIRQVQSRMRQRHGKTPRSVI